MLASSTGLLLLLYQALLLTLSILPAKVGKKENRNSPLVCTGPLKFVVLVNQIGLPVGVVWVSVNSAYIAKLCRLTTML